MTASTATIPVETITVEAKLLDNEAAGVTVVQSPPSSEQVRATEAVFAQERESNAALGLLGIWTSTVLLHDLALEHFWTSREDEDEEARRRKAKELLPETD